jgi:predicted small secreted protein
MSRRTVLSVGAALATLSLVPTAQAATSCGTLSGAGGDVLRVYALQGVSCKKAKSVARVVAQYPAPAPWHCLTGTGQKYKRKPVSFACGYGSRGPVMKRKHAFVAVQTHSAG